MEKEILKKLGLSENEIEIYFYLLKKSKLSPLEISLETKIERATVYRELERLKERGLCTEIIENGKKRYIGANPEKLIENLNQVKIEVQEIIPKLLKLKQNNSKKETLVEVFEKKEGIITVMSEAATAEEYFGIGSYKKWNDLMEFQSKVWTNRVGLTKKQRGKLLFTKEDEKTVPISKFEKTKILPKELENSIPFYIYDDTFLIFLVNSEKPISIRVRNKDLADSMKNYFNYIWDKTK